MRPHGHSVSQLLYVRAYPGYQYEEKRDKQVDVEGKLCDA